MLDFLHLDTAEVLIVGTLCTVSFPNALHPLSLGENCGVWTPLFLIHLSTPLLSSNGFALRVGVPNPVDGL